MIEKLFRATGNLFVKSKKRSLYRILFIFFFISPIMSLMILNYNKISDESLKNILSQKESLSSLAAATVQEKLNSLITFGLSLTSRQSFINEIENKNWPKAVNDLYDVSKNFPFIERIDIYDKDAIIKADSPSASPSVLGQSQADMDWYQRLKNDWNPHVSDVYKRSTDPRINVVSIVIPIKSMSPNLSTVSSSESKEKNISGILQLQLDLDVFSEWIEETYVGEVAIIYLVDQQGHIVYHPNFNYKDQIVDFSSVPTVQKLMRGRSGVDLNYNPIEKEERISAYAPVKKFGWGVVVTQPPYFALDARDRSLAQLIIVYGIVIILSILLALFVLHIIVINNRIQDLATHDFLTGLPNRILMEDRILTALIQAKRNKKMISVMSLDIDDFKDINDKYGHKIGDDVLKDISDRMKSAIRDSDTVSRYGGDEFVMLITNIENRDSLDLLLNRILDAVQQPLEYDSCILTPSISIGVVLSGSTQLSPKELIQKSDQALYMAKQMGKNHFVYSEETS